MNDEYVSVQEYISAINKLVTYSRNKRFHIKENQFKTSDTADYSLYLNDLIKQSIGIDIFSENAEERIQKYEIELNRLLSNFIARRITKRDISDEVDILRNSKFIDSKFLSKIDIHISSTVEDIVHQIPISKKELLDVVKQPISIMKYSAPKNPHSHYLFNSFVKINEYDFNIIMHLRNENKKLNTLFVMSIFIVPNSLSEKYENNPVRLFLACLDNWGVNLQINGKIKKIFALEKITGDEKFLEAFNFLSIAEDEIPKKYNILTSVVYENKNTMLADFTYGVNNIKYMEDLNQLFEN